jgi:hypothetical protein
MKEQHRTSPLADKKLWVNRISSNYIAIRPVNGSDSYKKFR